MAEQDVRYSLLKYADDVESYTDGEDIVEISSPSHRRHPIRPSSRCSSKCCKMSISLCATVLVTTCLTLAVIYSTTLTALFTPVQPSPLPTTVKAHSLDWVTEISNAASSSPLRAYDVSGDGILDIILGTNYDLISTAQCQGTCFYAETCYEGACKYGLMALDGHNGSVLWQMYTRYEIFELRCPAIDVDSDGVVDCIASGRGGTLLAFNPRSSVIFWSAPVEINVRWNVFAPGIVRDVDGDGTEDLVVINGGDPKYKPEIRNRTASYMLLLSGRTGETIGSEVFVMPDKRESYYVPMVYTTADGSQYVVFGTGGETIPGGLYIISLKYLLAYVSPQLRYHLPGKYNDWVEREEEPTGVVTLYKTAKTGVMVPASFVDLNNDGIRDIISTTFDGILLAFSGKDLSYLWQPKNFSLSDVNTQTYTCPAFGYFNDDDTLDIMVHWQTGDWPSYDTLMIYIIDGTSGQLLWYKDTPFISAYTVSAPIVLSTTAQYRDIFITRVTSTNIPFPNSTHHLDKDVKKRHFEADTSDGKSDCGQVDDVFVDTILVDRSVSSAPLLLYRQHSLPYYYNITDELISHRLQYIGDDDVSSHRVGRRHGDEESAAEAMYGDVLDTVRCSRSNLQDVPAGILTDMDSDGILDYIAIDMAYTKLSVRDGEFTGDVISKTTVSRFSLDVLHQLPKLSLQEVVTALSSSQEPSLTNLSLSPLPLQKWTQMFGSNQDGSY